MGKLSHPRRNPWYLAAALAMVLTTLVHLFVGGPEVYTPLRAAPIDPVVQSVLSVVWHMVSLMLAVMAMMLFALWRSHTPEMSVASALLSLGTALLFLGYGAADLGTPWPMPQWTIFLVVFALTCMGARRA